nr:MAG TPA: hypothetical protein [Caudoviricetes sp.]
MPGHHFVDINKVRANLRDALRLRFLMLLHLLADNNIRLCH